MKVMSEKAFTNLSFIFFLLNISFVACFSQEQKLQGGRIMFYNVENLFDTYNDSLTEDNEFLPDGLMRWNITRYNKKISSVYKTIIAAGEWDPPSIVAFCEIENRKVLEDLIYGTYLSKFDYSIIHEDSPDRRGIDVCLIYRKKLVDIVSYKYWVPVSLQKRDFNSRSVLYAKLVINSDTVHLFVNHWPSRRGGVLAGENNRLEIADMVREKADSLINNGHSDARIIILGDFNCTPDDQTIKTLIKPDDAEERLINLSDRLSNNGTGTYRYMGRWEMIDQVIVSKGLLESKNGLYTEQNLLKIFSPGFLLKKDPKYPGMTPYSTYSGYKYQGGFSDHLPVILDLKIKQRAQQD
jgi:endonuclease/exonuclease/phosphatase family metal-dependent hydrolase